MAKDKFHGVVKTALVKEGWTITYDPLTVKVGDVEMDIDLGADYLLGADRDNEKIAESEAILEWQKFSPS